MSFRHSKTSRFNGRFCCADRDSKAAGVNEAPVALQSRRVPSSADETESLFKAVL